MKKLQLVEDKGTATMSSQAMPTYTKIHHQPHDLDDPVVSSVYLSGCKTTCCLATCRWTMYRHMRVNPLPPRATIVRPCCHLNGVLHWIPNPFRIRPKLTS